MPFPSTKWITKAFSKESEPSSIPEQSSHPSFYQPDFKVHCLYDEFTLISQLKPHPKNRNIHPPDQIDTLAKILVYQGWRYPIKVSKQSGFITSGHGRLAAAIQNGWIYVPVNYQDYENEDQEYLDVQADNAIASWSALDLSGINDDLKDLGPVDLDLLGIKDFDVDMADKGLPPQKLIYCPHCGEGFERAKTSR